MGPSPYRLPPPRPAAPAGPSALGQIALVALWCGALYALYFALSAPPRDRATPAVVSPWHPDAVTSVAPGAVRSSTVHTWDDLPSQRRGGVSHHAWGHAGVTGGGGHRH